MLWHAIDGTEQVRRLRRHRGHAHGAREDSLRLSRLYEEENNLRSGGGACLHVIRSNTVYYLLILLFNYKIPSYIRRHAHPLLRREIAHECRRAPFAKLGHPAQPHVALAQCPNLAKGARGSPCHP